jgi:hypothetical protein
MGQSGRLWQAIAAATLQYPVYCGLKVNFMADRNINWLHSGSGAQGYPCGLPLVYHFSIATWLKIWLFMLTAKQ